MKCFNHQGVDAVAICKNCNKALCYGCAVDGVNGVCCSRSCEDEVRAINQRIRSNQTVAKQAEYERNAQACAMGGAGFLFLSFIAYETNRWEMLLVTTLSTLIFFIASFVNYSKRQKLKRDAG